MDRSPEQMMIRLLRRIQRPEGQEHRELLISSLEALHERFQALPGAYWELSEAERYMLAAERTRLFWAARDAILGSKSGGTGAH